MTELKALQLEVAELNRKFELLLNSLANGLKPTVVNECAFTLYSWLDEWYTIYKVPKLKPSSLRSLRDYINHIKRHLQDKSLSQVTGIDIQKTLNSIPYSRVRKGTYNLFNASFLQAYKLKLILDNPMLVVEAVKHKYKNGKALTVEQQQEFIKALAKNKLKPLYIFYLLTGCRKSEALTVKWVDVNYIANTIRISGTKTENAVRTIPLFDELKKLLNTIPKTSEFIFGYTINKVNMNFKRILPKLTFNFRIHDLRHTFATRCLEAGIKMNTVQKWLGHAKASTTSDIYSHITATFELEEIQKFNSKL